MHISDILNNYKYICTMENNIKKRITWCTESFITHLKTVHNNKYEYPDFEYKTLHHRMKIVCPKHGEFSQLANQHKKGHGCAKCAFELAAIKQKDTTKKFVEKAKVIHGDKYDYTETVYGKNAHEKVTIKCLKHGVFTQSPNGHLSGNGCIKCGQETTKKKLIQNQTGSWSKTDWVKLQKGRKSKLYVIRIFDKKESFLKIGITHKTLKRRFSKRLPYNYEIIKVIISHNASYIYDLEKILLKNTLKLRYKPLKKFNGETECRKIFDLKEYF